jgi:SAM-dependent methyltransferase
LTRRGTDWEELARDRPYYRLLTEEGLVEVESSAAATSAFLETGEADLSRLLSAVASIIAHDLALTTALDFGCGVGRLTLPLARRADTVFACDIAPTMLEHVRQNAESAGLRNITPIGNDHLAAMPDGSFRFVCSLLVFQYIPPAAGREVIRTLLRLLAPGGIAVLQVTLAPRRDALRRLAALSRRWSRGIETYRYDLSAIENAVESADARIVGRLPMQGSDMLIIEKGPELSGP